MSAALQPEPAPAGPKVKLSVAEATKELTGFELIGIEKHYGTEFGALGGSRIVMGLIWAYENRGGPPGQKVKWDQVEAMTMREMSEYFAPDAVDPEGPQEDFGASATAKRSGSRSSASGRASGRRTTTR